MVVLTYMVIEIVKGFNVMKKTVGLVLPLSM